MEAGATATANAAPANEVVIDGSILEGGGQVIRNSVALAALFSKKIRVIKVRHNRKRAGLMAQHLEGIRLVARLASAKLLGADKVGTTEFVFEPAAGAVANVLGAPPGNNHTADTTTAGSCMLLVQVSLPVLLFGQGPGPVMVSYKGGTNAAHAPPFDYFEKILQPTLLEMGVPPMNVYVKKRGFYPRGGGVVNFEVTPMQTTLSPLVKMERGDIVSVTGVAYVAGNIPLHVAERMVASARKALKAELRGMPIEIDVRQMAVQEALGAGTGIDLVAVTSTGCRLGAGALGERGVTAEDVGVKAAEALLAETRVDVTLDEHLCDQVIVFAALAAGRSMWRARMSMHARTAMHFVGMLTGAKMSAVPVAEAQLGEAEPVEGAVYNFVVDGIGYTRGVGPTVQP